MSNRLDLPFSGMYTISALCGGVGKTTLAYSLAKVTDNLLVIDTCPQCDLSRLFNIGSQRYTVFDFILNSMFPGYVSEKDLEKAYYKLTNCGKNSYVVSSSFDVTKIPFYMHSANKMIETLKDCMNRGYLYKKINMGLWSCIVDCMENNGVKKSLIDTSSFFSGATELAWFIDTTKLVVPVNGLEKSIQSLKKVIEKAKIMNIKIQLIVFTGNPTKQYRKHVNSIVEIKEIIKENISCFTTENPENHLAIFDLSEESARFISRCLWK